MKLVRSATAGMVVRIRPRVSGKRRRGNRASCGQHVAAGMLQRHINVFPGVRAPQRARAFLGYAVRIGVEKGPTAGLPLSRRSRSLREASRKPRSRHKGGVWPISVLLARGCGQVLRFGTTDSNLRLRNLPRSCRNNAERAG